ncbi:hypothetical protein GEMRC1_008210 [Eukaryota sp. GEM-RC1]
MKLEPSAKLLQLFDSDTLSDFTVSHRGQCLQLHRCILLSHSSYFETLFMGGYADSDDAELDLSNKLNVRFRILRQFFRYFYGGSLDIDHTNCYLYFYCSRYFMVDSIRTSCLNYMSMNIDSPLWVISWSSQASFMKDEAIYRDLNVDVHQITEKVNNLIFHQFSSDTLPPVVLSANLVSFLSSRSDQSIEFLQWYLQSLFLSVGSGIIEVRELERLLSKVEAVKFPGNCWDKAVISIVAEEPQLQSYFSNIISTKVTKSQQDSDDDTNDDGACTSEIINSYKKPPYIEDYGDFIVVSEDHYVECVTLPYQFCTTPGLPFNPKACISLKAGASFTLGVRTGFCGVIGQWTYHCIESGRPPVGFIFSSFLQDPDLFRSVEHRCTIVVPGATNTISAPTSLHFKSDRQFPHKYMVEFDYSMGYEMTHMKNFVVDFSLSSNCLRIWFDMKKTPNSSLQILPYSGSV